MGSQDRDRSWRGTSIWHANHGWCWHGRTPYGAGLDSAVNAAARIFAPLLLGQLYAKNTTACFVVGGGIVAAAAAVVLVRRAMVLRATAALQPKP